MAKDWQNYADGRVLSGKQALDLGFVDELGNFETAVDKAQGANSAMRARPSLVEYRVPVDIGSAAVSKCSAERPETPALKVDLGIELPRLEAGHLYYIMPREQSCINLICAKQRNPVDSAYFQLAFIASNQRAVRCPLNGVVNFLKMS